MTRDMLWSGASFVCSAPMISSTPKRHSLEKTSEPNEHLMRGQRSEKTCTSICTYQHRTDAKKMRHRRRRFRHRATVPASSWTMDTNQVDNIFLCLLFAVQNNAEILSSSFQAGGSKLSVVNGHRHGSAYGDVPSQFSGGGD